MLSPFKVQFIDFSLYTIKDDGGILTIKIVLVEVILIEKTNSRVKNMILIIKEIATNIYK
jgi:hypothetical protein